MTATTDDSRNVVIYIVEERVGDEPFNLALSNDHGRTIPPFTSYDAAVRQADVQVLSDPRCAVRVLRYVLDEDPVCYSTSAPPALHLNAVPIPDIDDMLRQLEARVREVVAQTVRQDPPWLDTLLDELGCSGGTIDNALQEVRNLVKLRRVMGAGQGTVQYQREVVLVNGKPVVVRVSPRSTVEQVALAALVASGHPRRLDGWDVQRESRIKIGLSISYNLLDDADLPLQVSRHNTGG